MPWLVVLVITCHPGAHGGMSNARRSTLHTGRWWGGFMPPAVQQRYCAVLSYAVLAVDISCDTAKPRVREVLGVQGMTARRWGRGVVLNVPRTSNCQRGKNEEPRGKRAARQT